MSLNYFTAFIHFATFQCCRKVGHMLYDILVYFFFCLLIYLLTKYNSPPIRRHCTFVVAQSNCCSAEKWLIIARRETYVMLLWITHAASDSQIWGRALTDTSPFPLPMFSDVLLRVQRRTEAKHIQNKAIVDIRFRPNPVRPLAGSFESTPRC